MCKRMTEFNATQLKNQLLLSQTKTNFQLFLYYANYKTERVQFLHA